MESKQNVLVFGASGRTGKMIVKKLLQEGFCVTAFVRNFSRVIKITHPHFSIIEGQISDINTIEDAISKSDIVVSALGNMKLKQNTIISDGVSTILSAMKLCGKSRLIFMSSLGIGDSKGQLGLIYNLIYLPTFLRNVFRDKERQEKLIHSSNVCWTIIRPAHFLPFALPIRYRACVMPKRPRILPLMSRLHTAEFIVKECIENKFINKNVALSYF